MKTEVSTKVYSLVADRLRSAHRILAVTHINPDGDALGSLCFFKHMVAAIGAECVPYCAGPLPTNLQFLPGFSEIITDKQFLTFKDFDIIVSLDCATLGRTNLSKEISERRPDQLFVEIDHHPASLKVSDEQIRETKAASTTEILWQFAKLNDFVVTPEMAKCLLTGLITDTANFIHPTVSQNSMNAAAALMNQGAHLSKISDIISQTKTLTSLKLWGLAFSRLTLNKKYNLVYTFLTQNDFQKYQASKDDLEGISGFLQSINNITASLILIEQSDNTIRGSLRTTRDDIDVARLAGYFGGGGHRKAAGFTVPGHIVEKNGHFSVEL